MKQNSQKKLEIDVFLSMAPKWRQEMEMMRNVVLDCG
jgi:hypothetical protein